MWIVSAISLTITMVLCVVGIFTPKAYFDDNLCQRIGMAGIFMFSWPRLVHLVEVREITSAVIPVSAQLAGHVGMALFAMGTAFKAYLDFKARQHPPAPAIPPTGARSRA